MRLWSQWCDWRSTPHAKWLEHKILAWSWFAFGVHGALRFAEPQWYSWGPNVATSIAVLFFISVYANYASEQAVAGTYRVEEDNGSSGRST